MPDAPTLRIENHRLVGEGVSWRATPNVGGALMPRYLVMHYTAGSSLKSSVESLCTVKAKGNASAHIVLGRDGSIVQLAPFNLVTWHAGVSAWNGENGLNSRSIGIEMDNAGVLTRVGERYMTWFHKEIPAAEVVHAAHRHGGPVQPWHAYTEKQIARALELAELLVQHYGLEDVLGHEDIARGRKTDPGPAFPLESVRGQALGREDEVAPHYVVTAPLLNIRKGPDASFDAVAPALKKGTRVTLLETGDRWNRVEVDGPTDIEGWVNNRFIVLATEVPKVRAAPATRTARTRATGSRAAAARTVADSRTGATARTAAVRRKAPSATKRQGHGTRGRRG